jgi:uncharacterized protein YcbK (DUF882 family)
MHIDRPRRSTAALAVVVAATAALASTSSLAGPNAPASSAPKASVAPVASSATKAPPPKNPPAASTPKGAPSDKSPANSAAPPARSPKEAPPEKTGAKATLPAKASGDEAAAARNYAAKPEKAGVVKLKRNGKLTTIALSAGGEPTKDGLAALAAVLADKEEDRHEIDQGLARLLVATSDHFGGRTIDVVAGYWPPRPGSKRHSAHTSGRAVDFRIEGVPEEVVAKYCSGLPHAGVGYYSAEQLVHLDVRRRAFSWSDKNAPRR